MSGDDLKSRVEQWLGEQGYPLEFATAAAFRAGGFDVFQGYHVAKEGGTRREVDVLAQATSPLERGFVRVSFVVECKWSGDKPWVVFVSGRGLAKSACIAQTMASQSGRAALWMRHGNEELEKLTVFDTPDSAGFSGRQAFSNNRDIFYEAMQAVTGAASSFIESYDAPAKNPIQHLTHAVIAFPLIVVKTALFQASFDSEKGSMTVSEQPHVRLHWRGSESWPAPHATVDIVTADHLPEFVRKCAADVSVLLGLVRQSLGNLRECAKKRSLNDLHTTKAPPGALGGPPLIQGLRQLFNEEKKR
jgi:hypothetical protein